MTDEKRQPRPATQYGPTGKTVAANVRRARERRGLTIYQLSAALKEAGRPIAPSAVAKIEREERQVTVDDLVALAVVLGVSPSGLLMPFTDRPDAPAEVTGKGSVPAKAAWDWADGRSMIGWDPRRPADDQHREWILYGWPAWLRPFRDEPTHYSEDQHRRSVELSGYGAFAYTEDGQPFWIYPKTKGDADDGPGVD